VRIRRRDEGGRGEGKGCRGQKDVRSKKVEGKGRRIGERRDRREQGGLRKGLKKAWQKEREKRGRRRRKDEEV
jgi:hypothetical protein